MIATECPTCHSGLEMHQVRAEKKFGQADHGEDPLLHAVARPRARPVAAQVGVHENISDSLAFLKEKGLA